MNKPLKVILGFMVAISVALVFYFEAKSQSNVQDPVKPFSPEIKIIGRLIDTAYLLADYEDRGAEYLFDSSASLDCTRYRMAGIKTGSVNTRITGTYYITYYADDIRGNPIAPQTRTVHVVENEAGFLNGSYDVSFSQTITPVGSKDGTISSASYTALITTASENKHFKLYTLNIGPEKLPQDVYVGHDTLEFSHFNVYYASLSIGGKLDRSRNSFSVETTVYPFSPKVVYKCTSVFTKQLVLQANKNPEK